MFYANASLPFKLFVILKKKLVVIDALLYP